MQILQPIDFPVSSPVVATIGFFDGVHRGHTFLIEQLKAEASRRGLRSMVITFPQHPRTVLDSDYRPRLLSTADEKLQQLETTGVDFCALLPFTKQMAALTSQEFMQTYLKDKLNVSALLIGYDHHFGSNRADGFPQYAAYGHEIGIEVVRAQAFTSSDLTVSSSAVRRFLEAGNVEMAKVCLGREYDLTGTVVEGRRVGHDLGYPTANLRCDDADKMLPADGVYAVHVLYDGMCLKGMLNIGCRPTLNNGIDRTIEVNILDFTGNLYGQTLTLRFAHRLRNEQAFANIDELRRQLLADETGVRNLLTD